MIPPEEQSIRSTPADLRRLSPGHDRIVNFDPSFDTVNRRCPVQERHRRGYSGTQRFGNPHGETQPIVYRGPTPFVIAPVRDGGEEAVEEIAVGAVDFDEIEAGPDRPHGCFDERVDRPVNFVHRHGPRSRPAFRHGNGARRDGLPRARRIEIFQRSGAFEWQRRTALATGVCQLDADGSVMGVVERRDLRQTLNVTVAVYPEAAVRDAPVPGNCRGFHQRTADAAQRKTAMMGESASPPHARRRHSTGTWV